MVPAPNKKSAKHWGDYHFALALKKQIRMKNFSTRIFFRKEWNKENYSDVVIVLRGLHKYETKPNQFNIMWNISHPELVSIEEYNSYDYIFISSIFMAEELGKKLKVPIKPLLQCTDEKLFFPEKSNNHAHELLFVGNSRGVFRKIIKDLLPTKRELGLYGQHWEKFITKEYISDTYIPNHELNKLYSSCKILLNDHWQDMAKNGFVSNRIFDGLASGAFIISDEFEDSKKLFGDFLVTYSDKKQLKKLIDYYIENEDERIEKARMGRKIVLNNHTFEKRAEEILELIKNFKK